MPPLFVFQIARASRLSGQYVRRQLSFIRLSDVSPSSVSPSAHCRLYASGRIFIAATVLHASMSDVRPSEPSGAVRCHSSYCSVALPYCTSEPSVMYTTSLPLLFACRSFVVRRPVSAHLRQDVSISVCWYASYFVLPDVSLLHVACCKAVCLHARRQRRQRPDVASVVRLHAARLYGCMYAVCSYCCPRLPSAVCRLLLRLHARCLWLHCWPVTLWPLPCQGYVM
jgi:hypothetical protein